MTDVLTSTSAQTRSHRARPGAMMLAIVVLVGATAGFVRWRSSLDIVTAYGPTVTVPVQVGQTYYVDAGLGPSPADSNDAPSSVTVTIDRADAGADLLTTTATSGAITGIPVEAVLCVRRPGSNGIGVTAEADLTASCSSVRPLVLPETLALGLETNQVMYKVPITAVGTYQGFGMTVDYHQGIRTGALRATADTSLIASK